jgi:hypothetical protein
VAIAEDRLFDAKSFVIGAAACVLMLGVATVWRMAAVAEHKLAPIKEFVFTPEAPNTEKFELKDPQRQLLEQKTEQPDKMDKTEEMVTPHILITTEIMETDIPEEVVKTESIEVTTDVDVKVKEMDIVDAPEELTEVTEQVTYAITPIAAVVKEGGDLIKLKEAPRHRPRTAFANTAPRPSLGLKMMPRQFGDLDAPTIGELGPVSINLLGSGEYMGALGRSGSLETRTAVDAALRWLAMHQEPQGYWAVHKWDPENVSPTPPGGSGGERDQHVRGITGFAVLGLMGGGHTIRKGEYRTHLYRALEYLMKNQTPQGQLSPNMYEHSICTIALCEAFGRSPDERLGLAARKAVDFCVKARGADDGWRYTPNPPTASDMSVSSWFLQALKTAKLANIKFDHTAFSRGQAYVDQLTDKGGVGETTGAVGYQYVEGLEYGHGSPALTCAAMVIRQFSGIGPKAPVLARSAELTRKRPPDWEAEKDFYYWYYATYAMHNMGGEYRIWWNKRIRDVLLDHQSKQGHQAGSWDPENVKWDGGRVYCTALGALCLEVYYRYGEALQSFGTVPDLQELFFQ